MIANSPCNRLNLLNSGYKDRFIFFLRHRVFFLGWLRAYFFRHLGMEIGVGTALPRIYCPWPHQVRLGANCRIEQEVYFHFDGVWKPGPSILIGDECFLGAGCEFNSRLRIEIGSKCLIAAGCRLVDHDHDISGTGPLPIRDGPVAPVLLHDHVWIGANAVILKGVEIGKGAVVAAGAVVTKSIPPNEIWAGLPARKIAERKDA
jgi:acetyltransferase-like isoleucine patch superfamily enzyme